MMDLYNIERYLSPQSLDDIDILDLCSQNSDSQDNNSQDNNSQDINTIFNKYTWLAGGTWLFSEPQPNIKGVIDIQGFGWDEIEILDSSNNQITSNSSVNSSINYSTEYLSIGAACPLIKLLDHNWSSEWEASIGFKSAISALSASFKVVNMATLGGNICLALSVGTFAPLMIALDAVYEIWNSDRTSDEVKRFVNAQNFQTGHRQTTLKSGEILRRVLIPLKNLHGKISYQRFGIASSDPAIAIVVFAQNQLSDIRCVIGASVDAPYLMKDYSNDEELQSINFIEDIKASSNYRQEITKILIQRCLKSVGGGRE